MSQLRGRALQRQRQEEARERLRQETFGEEWSENPGQLIVGCELVRRDRESFDSWWPQHLMELAQLVDKIYLRVEPESMDAIQAVVKKTDLGRNGSLVEMKIDPQFTLYGRFQEDAERQELLKWATEVGAAWVACFDADEVIEPGGGSALRSFLRSRAARQVRLVRLILSYSSHHRPGYVLPRGEIKPWRAFRIDNYSRKYVYRSDRDGLHCGSVPAPGVSSVTCPDLRVIHYHATSCEEYMDERRFYDQTIEVHKHGGIDWLYRCDRFGDEAAAIPLEQELSGATERLARVVAGEGMTR